MNLRHLIKNKNSLSSIKIQNNIRSYVTPLQRKKIVVLGAGQAGFRFLRSIDRSKYDISVVSPRNYFLFTPLLPPTTVGTLEFRCVTEPVRTLPGHKYFQSHCTSINPQEKTIVCRDFFVDKEFSLDYDTLVFAVGARSNTFGIEGVTEHCHFLKQLSDARAIRSKILELFEIAASPSTTNEERQRMLTFVIIGGGPTNVEFAAELHDFLVQDIVKLYPTLADSIQVYLIEAADRILGNFTTNFSRYTEKLYRKRNINVLTGTTVNKVTKDEIFLSDGTTVPYGIAVQNTGNAPSPLVESLNQEKDRSGRLVVDDQCVPVIKSDSNSNAPKVDNIFAIGDCAVNPQINLPPTAQVAQQEGGQLASMINKHGITSNPTRKYTKFTYNHRGMLAYIGNNRALAHIDQYMLKGISAWFIWNSAYVTQLVSQKNRIVVPITQLKSKIFGRDITQI